MNERQETQPTLAAGESKASDLRTVITMALPLVVTSGSRALMDVSDFILIKHLDSQAAKAAILPAQMAMWIALVAGMAIVSMINTYAAQSLGRKRYRDCAAYAWQSLYLAAAFAVVTLALRPFLPWLVAHAGHAAEVQEMELAYARVAILTVGPTVAATGLASFFTGIHRPAVALWSVLEANVVNVLASIVLMFGFMGFEPMGIAGAAWGTFIAGCYRTLRLTIVLVGPGIAETFHTRATWRPSWTHILGLFRIGLPTSLHWISDVAVWALFISLLIGTNFGTEALIATNIAWQYMRIAFVPALGLGQAVTALVGRSIGAGDPDRADREARIVIRLTLAYMATLSVVYAFAGPTLIAWFDDQPAVVTIGAKVMICAAIFQLFDALTITYVAALRGAGDTIIPGAFIAAVDWILILGGGWLIVRFFPNLGSLGPWLAASGVLIICGIFFWWRWRRGGWRKIDLFKNHPQSTALVDSNIENQVAAAASNG
jgi:MATE family multidrug resistance protein